MTRFSKWISRLFVLIMILLGSIGMFTRWANPKDLMVQGGTGISFANLVDFPQNYGKSFNGNFLFRDVLIRLDYQARYHLLKETVYPQVLIGSQGWMYYTSEGNLDYYQRVRPFTEEQINTISGRLNGIQEELNRMGKTFLFVIAPNKETLYPEFLPAGIPRADNPTWADQISQSLTGTDVNLLDLRPVLMAERKNAHVYFKTDTHWNPVGARAAYEAILLALQPSYPILIPHPLSDFDQVTEIGSGDLASLIHMKGEITEEFTALHARFEKPSRGLKNPPAGQMITDMPDPKLPKAVIFRDSFFNGLQPFTSEHFSRVVYVSDVNYDASLVLEENPDIVILEVAERYLYRLLENY